MRHRKSIKRLGRSPEHHAAMVSALLCGLITDKRITTTLVKAKLTRQAAEKMVTAARKGTLAARRRASAALHRPACVKELFDAIVPKVQERKGGYTRVIKLGHRVGDCADLAMVEWLDVAAPVTVPAVDTTETKPK